MRRFFFRLLRDLTSAPLGEAERYLQLRSLRFAVRAVQETRRIYLLLLGTLVAGTVGALGLALLVFHAAAQLDGAGALRFDLRHAVALAMLSAGAAGLAFFLSEKRWLKFFGLARKIETLALRQESKRKEELLEERVERIVEEKMSEAKRSQPPPLRSIPGRKAAP